MLDQAAVEDLYSATYVETYLDAMDNLPDDIQRHLSRMRELDVTYQAYLKEVERQTTRRSSSDPVTRKQAQLRVGQALIAVKEVGDEKLNIILQIEDLIENKSSQLVHDYRHLDGGMDQENTEAESGTASTSSGAGSGERQSKRARRTRVEPAIPPEVIVTPEPVITAASTSTSKATKKGSTGKKKTRKSRQSQQQQREESPPREDEVPVAIDPDESTYCLCELLAYGQMILCDNDLCPIKWFHFSCVNLVAEPKRKWFCPKCRGVRSNTMKPKAQFVKKAERNNKKKGKKA